MDCDTATAAPPTTPYSKAAAKMAIPESSASHDGVFCSSARPPRLAHLDIWWVLLSGHISPEATERKPIKRGRIRIATVPREARTHLRLRFMGGATVSVRVECIALVIEVARRIGLDKRVPPTRLNTTNTVPVFQQEFCIVNRSLTHPAFREADPNHSTAIAAAVALGHQGFTYKSITYLPHGPSHA
jgi:hypothetical protein